MLSEKHTKLLTALVDGELSSRQQKQAQRLLKKMPEARELYKQLQADADALSALPRSRLPEEFPLQIMRELAQHKPVTLPATPAAATPAAFPTWAGAALAASLLVGVTVGSFLFFSDMQRRAAPPSFAGNGNKVVPDLPKPKLQLTIAQLQKDDSRELLNEAIRNEDSLRFEVNCASSAKAVTRLSRLLQETDIGLIVEKHAKQGLKSKKGGRYILYMENVLPYEVATLLYDLGKGEKVTPSSVTGLSLFAMTDENRQQVADLMGLSSDDLKPAAKAPANRKREKIDLLGMIPVQGKGKNRSKSGNAKAKSNNPTRFALLLPVNGNASSADEVRRFLQARGTPRPGTLQLVFVLNEVNV